MRDAHAGGFKERLPDVLAELHAGLQHEQSEECGPGPELHGVRWNSPRFRHEPGDQRRECFLGELRHVDELVGWLQPDGSAV